MLIFKQRHLLEDYLHIKKHGSIGFVPTMGALHKGHLSLIETSKLSCSLTVSSIYVNPTQFNNLADYEKYPYTPDKDIALLESSGCDVLYLPDTKDIYGETLPVNEYYPLGFLETTLEGQYRPGHYQGVCMVVRRLLEAVKPQKMFLGLKDYQQVMVIRRLVAILDIYTEVIGCSTLREDNGLAMSSRNLRLTPSQKQTATVLIKTLTYIKENYSFAAIDALCKQATELINNIKGMRTEYFDIRNADTLQPMQSADEPALALTAAFCGEVRLIDNLMI